MYSISFPNCFFPHFLEELLIYHGFDFLCLQSCAIKSQISFFFYVCLCCPGAVLLVSVQGIAVNMDPVFCTWLLYQPHRGSSRQQQQVHDPLSCSQTRFICFRCQCFPYHCFFLGGQPSKLTHKITQKKINLICC